MSEQSFDLIIVGAGPGGYVAAIRAAQLGMRVAVVEKRAELGGVCLNEGCIPSKALLESSEWFAKARDKFALHGICIDIPRLDLGVMMQRKEGIVNKLGDGIDYLFKKYGVTRFHGLARLAGVVTGGLHAVEIVPASAPSNQKTAQLSSSQSTPLTTIFAARILLATGSEPIALPEIDFDGHVVVSAREALTFRNIPGKLVVAGGGYVGLEMATIWNRLGTQVTIIENQPHILSNMDRQVAETIYRSLRKQGIQFRLDSSITGANRDDSNLVVKIECGSTVEDIACECLLVAVGRRPVITGTGIIEAGIRLDKNSRLLVDKDFQTSLQGVYALGDLIPGPMLAHKASDEAVVCVERMAGLDSVLNYEYIPGVVYTSPEAASVGKSEEQLKADAVNYKVGSCNFMTSGRARCMGETDGFVKILADHDTDRILGVHIAGPHAADLIAEAVVVMRMEGTSQDIATTCHAHPTFSEVLREAALDVHGSSIHS